MKKIVMMLAALIGFLKVLNLQQTEPRPADMQAGALGI